MMTAPRPTKTVSADKMARLQAWNDRKPVIAIMGEFSAGKSTLLNMLIGQAILPTQITATKLPPVWLRHGNEAPYRVDRNNVKHPIDLNNLAGIPLKDTRYIRIYVESEVLESCDLLDTPGISDPNIPMTMWFKTLGYASAALWCTHAGQAWRESERGAWESLPERLRRHSILLVTRADKITNEIDRMKIDNRLRRETDSLFGARLFISLVNALRALEGEGDADMWAASGAEAFVENLAGAIAAINEDRVLAIRRFRLDPNEQPRVAPRRIRPGDAPAAPVVRQTAEIAAPMGGGADVVPLRPRVVATNDAPSATERPVVADLAADRSLRGAFLRAETPSADLVDHEPDADLEADFVDVDSEFGEDAASADWSEAALEVETVEMPGAAQTAPDAAVMVDAELLELTEEYGLDLADLTADQVEDDVEVEEAPFVAVEPEVMATTVTAFEEVVTFEELGEETDAEEFAPEELAAAMPTAVFAEAPEVVEMEWDDADFDVANLDSLDPVPAEPDMAEEPSVETSAEETISAVMARFAAPDVVVEAEESDDDEAEDQDDGPVTAAGLWRSVLADRPVQTVQDLLAAMGDFVEQLDAAGFKLNSDDDRTEDSAETGNSLRALRAQRRQARLTRQRRA
ncbi:dynamin family protein [Neogemmobacter tilapiae]|uniref:Dynamin N-terminal domain-containing protein n=1 Tax=Neogemmobacter tilapiae TaxID=875041 RepID=A0A918U1Z3_9RHOB|nr:dynamin family protein [Gemmobacter tilapiae]GHC66781.1 hypothetical protein GCM10007315_34630 [Gemmobacter tilapiae]